ncbi:MAG: DUF4349 domain-containing protein [Thermonemataceae bacterium]
MKTKSDFRLSSLTGIYIALVLFLIIACDSTAKYRKRGGQSTLKKENQLKKVPQRIISSAYLTLVCVSPDSTAKTLETIANKYEGYALELGTQRAVLRVEAESIDAALEEIKQLGEAKNLTRKAEDVTDQYADAQIRLENAEKTRNRYLELLKKAEDVEATLLVEKELQRLTTEIELLKGTIERLEHLSTFATISITLTEKKKKGVLGVVFVGLYEGVKWLFVRN